MSLQPVLSAAAMKAADHATIADWGVPGRVLMEAAGRAAAREIAERYPVAGTCVSVLIGAGNNGGDGAVVARDLASRGARIRAVVVEGTETPDRAANVEWLRQLASAGADITIASTPGDPPDLIVDALLGIGMRGELRAPADALCAWANACHCPIAALDVPSGLDATTGRAASGAIDADLTVAFGALKTGLLVADGPRVAGDVVTVEIGIPEVEMETRATTWLASRRWAGSRLPRRLADAHKYSAGRVLAVVGSRPYTGAAVLATGAALRAGAGAVVAASPSSIRPTLDAHHPEVMVHGLPETDSGTLSADARDAILDRARSADAVLIGCGLGRANGTQALVRDLVQQIEAPVVLDADGLAAFDGDADAMRQRDGHLVLTPHLGELRRLVGDAAWNPEDRVEAVRQLAIQWNATLVAKGTPTLVASPDGRVLIGPPATPVLATAGTGDTLAGSTVSLIAQGCPPGVAAVCALWLGASAAQLWSDRYGDSGFTASDLVAGLPRAARSLVL